MIKISVQKLYMYNYILLFNFLSLIEGKGTSKLKTYISSLNYMYVKEEKKSESLHTVK